MRVVFDTNIFISAVILHGNESKLLIAAHNGIFKLVTSLSILKEFKEVISRSKFGFSNDQIKNLILHIIEISEIVEPNIRLDMVKDDPADNKILECAVYSKADLIISGDKHILNLKKIKGIPIIKSSELLQRL